ncbi:polyhydroxyalkanoate depolymerase [Aquicoccus sp. SCR17]|nr:polyhydroxyalkanoate depolymerase [Carideicomes alvinocaridis]
MIARPEQNRGADQPKYRDLALERLAYGGRGIGVSVSVLHETPFYTLRQFRREDGAALPDLLVVPPLSGHFPILLRDMVLDLLPDFRVALMDWANVRHVPASCGAFGFDDNVDAIVTALTLLGPDLSVVALCQAGVPALAAIADLAARERDSGPGALVLIASPVDPLARATPVVDLIRSFPAFWYETVPIDRVAADHAGQGRRVYRAESQLAGLTQYLRRHAEIAGDELAEKMTDDDGAEPERFPFADLYTSIMDLDARHFAENIARVFLQRDMARGRLHVGGRRVDPGYIRRSSLLTVEGALDDIAAPGQTRAAHRLCTGIRQERRQALVVPGCGHFGLFHGRPWRDSVLPVLREHCLRNALSG